jgi:hypothetical protein
MGSGESRIRPYLQEPSIHTGFQEDADCIRSPLGAFRKPSQGEQWLLNIPLRFDRGKTNLNHGACLWHAFDLNRTMILLYDRLGNR